MNVTHTDIMTFQTSEILDQVTKFLVATRAELFLFCAAVAAYVLLFGNAHPKRKQNIAKAKKIKVVDDYDDDPLSDKTADSGKMLSEEDVQHLAQSFAVAFEAGDHRQVLRCWNALKRSERVPPISLAQAVESMQRFKKDSPFVSRELKAFFKRFPNECEIGGINDLLDSLAKRLDSELVDQVVDMLPSMGLKEDQRTCEILLTMQFTTRNFAEVRRLLGVMQSEGLPLTTRATIVAVKTALKTGSFDDATLHFRSLKALWANLTGDAATASTAPRHIVSQLVELACREQQLGSFLPLLEGVPVSDDAVAAMLSECVRRKDPSLTSKVEKLVRGQGHQLSDATYTLLVKSASGDIARVQKVFDEVVAKGTPLTGDFALALLAFCTQTRSSKLADALFEYMKPKQILVLAAFIRFYADTDHPDKACDVYEQHLQCLRMSGSPVLAQQAVCLDARLERSLMNAALRCGRNDLAKIFLDASPSDVAKHITMIRNCAASGNLKGAMKVFETLKSSGTEVNSIVYNTVLDACVECRDLAAAEAWMIQTKAIGLADVVSYNTLIKAHLQVENFNKARALMEEMRSEGLQPNRVTFNELVNGLVTRGSSAQRVQIWEVIKEMKAAGVKPNQVTCSILLKSLNAHSREADIMETMELISAMDEPMDEVLLSSVVEACVRIGKPDLLSQQLKQLHSTHNIAVNGSHTFGSLIKAYGYAKDMDGVWRCWKEMRSRHIRPTSITLGCMVEAVVSNGDTEGAYDLIHQMQEDDRCREALNAVIYCSVLKGFTREKKIQRVWTVYEEMLKRKVDLSIVTYNTLLDACARCSRMDKAPAIVEDMKAQGIQPNLITYSTMVKGHCQAGDIDRGFATLEQMKQETTLQPDEILYNSLLDGCAQNNLAEEGLGLLSRMEKEGVPPSNFTLSLLVKLMNRCRKLDSAFTLVEDICKRYKFRPNVHVYSNLIQACVANRQLPRALTTFGTMLQERIRPESRTYAILIRASITQGQCDQAAGLLRAALGLPGSQPFVSDKQASLAAVYNFEYALVSEALQGFADKGHVQELAVALMSDIKRLKPAVRIDPAVQRRLMAAGMASEGLGDRAPVFQSGRQDVAAGNRQQRSGGSNYNRTDNRSWRS